MSKGWMPLYVGDYLADTQHLTTTQHGAYLLLIMHYWQHGGLPNSEAAIAGISRLNRDQWRSNCSAIAGLFQPGWKHKRIDAELEKAKELSEKRAMAGRRGANRTNAKNRLPFPAIARQSRPQSQSHIESSTYDSEIEPTQNGHDFGDFGSPTRSLATALPTGALARGSSSQTNSKLKPLAVSPQLEAIIKTRGWDDE